MFFLIIIGAILTVAGLGGLAYCIREGFRMRHSGLPPEEINAQLHKLVAVNLGSVGTAALGLALIVAGVLL